MPEIQQDNKEHTITAFVCVKDSKDYMEAWLENTRSADHIVVLDGGSRDGTIEIIMEEFKLNPDRMTVILQREGTEKFKWNEEEVRNQCMGLFKTEWVLLQDVDELVSNNFWEWFRSADHSKNDEKIGYYIPHHNLWLSDTMFRIDGGWYPDLTLRLFKLHRGFYWVGSEHASLWRMGRTSKGTGECSPTDPETPVAGFNEQTRGYDIHFEHYHRFEPGYAIAVMDDAIPHHSNEKRNMSERPVRARLREQPVGAGLIKRRFDKLYE